MWKFLVCWLKNTAVQRRTRSLEKFALLLTHDVHEVVAQPRVVERYSLWSSLCLIAPTTIVAEVEFRVYGMDGRKGPTFVVIRLEKVEGTEVFGLCPRSDVKAKQELLDRLQPERMQEFLRQTISCEVRLTVLPLEGKLLMRTCPSWEEGEDT